MHDYKMGDIAIWKHKPVRVVSQACSIGENLYWVVQPTKSEAYIVHGDTLRKPKPWEEAMYLLGDEL